MTIEYSKFAMTSQCPQGATNVSARDELCPNCGALLQQSSPHNGFWSQIGNVLLAVLALAFGGVGICTMIEGLSVGTTRSPTPMHPTVWLFFALIGSLCSLFSFAIVMYLLRKTRHEREVHDAKLREKL